MKLRWLVMLALGVSIATNAKTGKANLVLPLTDKHELQLPAPELSHLTSKFKKDLICSQESYTVSNDFERAVECKLQDGVAGQIFIKQLKDTADAAPLMDIQFLNPAVNQAATKRYKLAWGEVIQWSESNNGGSNFYYLRENKGPWYVLRLSNMLTVTPEALQLRAIK